MKTTQTPNESISSSLAPNYSRQKKTSNLLEMLKETVTSRALDAFTCPLNCFAQYLVYTKDFNKFIIKIYNYIPYLKLLHSHLKSYRSAFLSYRINTYSVLSSLSFGYVTPYFLTPTCLAETIHEFTMEEVDRCRKLTPAIQEDNEATCYEIQIVLQVSISTSGISVKLRKPLNSKSATFNIIRAIPMYQANEDGSIASVY